MRTPALILTAFFFLPGCHSANHRTGLLRENTALRRENEVLREQNADLHLELHRGSFAIPQAFVGMSPGVRDRFHLHLLDFRAESPFGAARMATADCDKGDFNILSAGLSAYSKADAQRLLAQHQIALVHLFGCNEGPAAFEFVNAYNAVSMARIKAKFGRSIDELILLARGSR